MLSSAEAVISFGPMCSTAAECGVLLTKEKKESLWVKLKVF